MALMNPVLSGWKTDAFGPRGTVPGLGDLGFHTGRDIAAPYGTPIVAAHSGTVLAKWYDRFASGAGAGGWMISIRGDDGLETRYAHMAGESPLRVGQRVTAGRTVLGAVGASGAANGAHLHLEVLQNGHFVDPDQFMGASDLAPAATQTRKEKSMATLYCTTDNNKRPGKGGTGPAYFLAGDSPGTPANWLPTRDVELATQWAAAHGNAVWLTKDTALDYEKKYQTAVKTR